MMYFSGFSQEKYPKEYFQFPLKIPIVLSGSFGELRNNHFHSGLDIKTQGKEGLPVFASADGYVSRIKIGQFGYGKALYISHPNGFTTVYAHLKQFEPKIEQYIKNLQYEKETYEIEIDKINEDIFTFKKGDLIAFSGNTGGSSGPHLHFEIRDTESEKIINPLFFGLNITDSIPPIFRSLKVFALSDSTHINNQLNDFQIPLKKISKNEYISDKIAANNSIGFGVDVYDKMNGSYNKLGIQTLEMFVNGKRLFYHDVETFSFFESKFINLHIDYEYFKEHKKRIQKTFVEVGNELSTYKELIQLGKITLEKGMNYSVNIIAKDANGNTSSLKIPLAEKSNNSVFKRKIDTTNFRIKASEFNKFELDHIKVAFPKNTFYKDTYLDIKVENGIAKIHNPTIPLDKKFTLTFDVSNYSEEDKKQLYIANLEYPKYPRYLYTRKKENIFFTTTYYLGNYTLLLDNQKPTIQLLYVKNNQWISNSKTLKVKVTDIGSGIDTFRATLDNEWILMEYNHNTGILTYNFDDKKLVGTKHLFKIVVYDNVGNTNELTATFFKKQIN